MACTTTGVSTPFGEVISDIVPLLVNVYLADRMLDAQEYYEDQMIEVADVSLTAAEELFEKHMLERSKDSAVFDFMNDTPLYEYCDRTGRAFSDGKRLASEQLRQGMGGLSRYDTGRRHKLIMDAASTYVAASAAAGVSADNYEHILEDEYYSSHYDAITGSALGAAPNLRGAFGGAGAAWSVLSQEANQNAQGFIAGVGYFGSRLLQNDNFFGQSQPDNRLNTITTGESVAGFA